MRSNSAFYTRIQAFWIIPEAYEKFLTVYAYIMAWPYMRVRYRSFDCYIILACFILFYMYVRSGAVAAYTWVHVKTLSAKIAQLILRLYPTT